MFISKKSFIGVALFLTTINCFSQEIEKPTYSFVPTSIFTPLKLDSDINSYYNLNEKLNFSAYKFVFLDEKKIKEGYFTIPIENRCKIPSSLIFETYAEIYHHLNLEKSFFKVSDLYKVSSRIKQ